MKRMKSTNPVRKIAGVAMTVIAALVLSNTGYAAVADFDSVAHGEKLFKRPSDKERKTLTKGQNKQNGAPKAPAAPQMPKPTASSKAPAPAPTSAPKPKPTTTTKAPASSSLPTSTRQPKPSASRPAVPPPASTSQQTLSSSRLADEQHSDVTLNASPSNPPLETTQNAPQSTTRLADTGGTTTGAPEPTSTITSSTSTDTTSTISSTGTSSSSSSLNLGPTATNTPDNTPPVDETPAPKMIVTDGLMSQIRQAFMGGERSMVIRSQQYLDELAEAFRSIYNRLEDQGARLDIANSGVIGERIPDFPTEQSTVDGQTVSSAFQNYSVVRGVAASNPEIAALSMRIKVEHRTKEGWFGSVTLQPCGPDFFQITMVNNAASASQWTTVVNPDGKDTKAVKQCLNINNLETVFRSVTNEVHLAQTHTAAMIEAIILMIVDGEANGSSYRLTLVENSKEGSKDEDPSLKALLLKDKAPSEDNGKEITDADFIIINN